MHRKPGRLTAGSLGDDSRDEAKLGQPSTGVFASAGSASRFAPTISQLVEGPEASRRLGPFVLVEQLGRGGFAPVWLACETYGDTTLRTAAVKLFALPVAGTASEHERGRIIAEARALCRVEHPNVVRFYSLAIDEERSIMGLAMEHVAGTPLDRWLDKNGPMLPSDALAVGGAVASALAAVHRAGLVHRDVKPSNIVEASGIYKLIDFGIAGGHREVEGAFGSEQSEPDQTQRIAILAGTTGYIDPECIAKRLAAEPVSDLYALGATLFALLTGKLPASGDEGLRAEVIEGRALPPGIAQLAPDTPLALCELVDALLAPARADRPTSAEWVAIRIEQIRRELGGTLRAPPPESVGPFRGLGRFEAEDREVYFGRSGEVAAALETLRGRGVVALLGRSGSGKSSLARAGLLPAVADGALGDRPAAWDLAVASPGVNARSAIVQALVPFVPNAESLSPAALIACLAERVHSADRGLLLFVDQLEELATISDPATTEFVVELLREVGERPLVGVRAVVAARRDQLDPLLALTDLGKVLLRGSVLVEPLTDSVWGDVIDRALAVYAYQFEDAELRAEILTELVSTSEAMPLVQFAFTQFWRLRDRANKRLTRAGVRAVGGIAGALERHAEATMSRLLAEPQVTEEELRALILSLTTPRGTRATRSRAELVELAGPSANRMLQVLESDRLIVSHGDNLTLAHEALITSWGSLRRWLSEEQEQRLLAESLELAAESWVHDSEHAPLWRKLRLENGEQLARSGHIPLSEAAKGFLSTSRSNTRRRLLLLVGSIVVLVAGAGAAAASYLRAIQAEQAKTAAALLEEQESRKVAEQRTHEVQAAQVRIDGLLKDLADSPKKEQVLELQRRIRSADSPGVPRPGASRGHEPPAAPVAPQPAASAAPSAIKIQREWQ